MSREIIVPRENVNDPHAILIAWRVPSGTPVKAGQPVVELETSKSTFELPAEQDGILVHDRALGEEVPIGEVLGRVLSAAEFSALTPAAGVPPVPTGMQENVSASTGPTEAETTIPGASGPRATPGARRLALSLGVDLSKIIKSGVIRESDVQQFHKSQSAGAASSPGAAPAAATSTAPTVPTELLAQWKVLDPDHLPPAGGLVYSREFVQRILSGGYGAHSGRPSTKAALLTTPALVGVAIGQAVIGVFARIPILNAWIETMSRVYTRNSIGFFLRGAYYKARLGALGPDNIIDQYVEIWGGRNVFIGRGCHLDMYARLAAGESSQGQKGRIEIGDHVHIGPQVQLAGRGGIKIGSYTAITAGSKIFSATNVGDNPDDPTDLLPMSHAAPLHRQRIYEAPVVIADHVFVGLNVSILPGVKIGRGAIVNSGSVVTRDVPEFAIVGGNPARIQGYRVPKLGRTPARASTT